MLQQEIIPIRQIITFLLKGTTLIPLLLELKIQIQEHILQAIKTVHLRVHTLQVHQEDLAEAVVTVVEEIAVVEIAVEEEDHLVAEEDDKRLNTSIVPLFLNPCSIKNIIYEKINYTNYSVVF